jgi:hypothetical protein
MRKVPTKGMGRMPKRSERPNNRLRFIVNSASKAGTTPDSVIDTGFRNYRPGVKVELRSMTSLRLLSRCDGVGIFDRISRLDGDD